jgi:hypothetical protein
MGWVRIIAAGWLMCACVFSERVCEATGWETVLKAGYDSNINRAVKGEKSDSYLSGSIAYSKGPTGESRLGWLFSAALEGAAFDRFTDLTYGLITVSPGLGYFLSRRVSVAVSPFFEAKAVKNSDQSALATGGKVMLREQFLSNLYLGQYYAFKASSANVDTYSYTENAFGAFAGVKLSTKATVEIGYEYSYGDSFRAVASGPGGGGGRGRGRGHQIFSQTFQELVIREPVDRNAFGVNLSVDWSKSTYSTISYVYTSMTGDSGDSNSHTGYIAMGCRF